MDVKKINPFIEAITVVMPQLGFSEVRKAGMTVIKSNKIVNPGVMATIGMVGDVKGNVAYAFHTDDAKKVASTMMMGMPVAELDDMAKSAISEMSNMLSARSCMLLSEQGFTSDISPPTLLYGGGELMMAINQVLCIQMIIDTVKLDAYIAIE